MWLCFTCFASSGSNFPFCLVRERLNPRRIVKLRREVLAKRRVKQAGSASQALSLCDEQGAREHRYVIIDASSFIAPRILIDVLRNEHSLESILRNI